MHIDFHLWRQLFPPPLPQSHWTRHSCNQPRRWDFIDKVRLGSMILLIPPERETCTNLSVLPVIVIAVVEGLVLNLLLLILFLWVLAPLFTLPIVVWVIFFLLSGRKIKIDILAFTQFNFDVFAQTNLSIGLLHTVWFIWQVRPRKWLSVRLHSKSLQKSSKCQNFLRVWHLVSFRADQ